MRMPNGYGSVYKLKDRKYTGKDGKVHYSRRRNPWAARVTTGYRIVGKKAYPVYYFVGYYPTRVEAMTALEDYKRSGSASLEKMTFSEVYERWSEKKFQDLKVSDSYMYSYRSCGQLHRIQMSNITVPELQDAIDRLKSYSAMNNMKLLFLQLFEFAYVQGAVSVDMKERVRYLDIEHGAKIQRRPHVPFTREEIRRLIDQDSPLVLILVLSGVRISELLALKMENVHLEERWFYVEDSKTASGIRDVPIHESLVPCFEKIAGREYLIEPRHTYRHFMRSVWCPEMERLAMDHTPHDARHACATLLEEAGVDDRLVKAILGHKRRDITGVYSHLGIDKKIEAINRVII